MFNDQKSCSDLTVDRRSVRSKLKILKLWRRKFCIFAYRHRYLPLLYRRSFSKMQRLPVSRYASSGVLSGRRLQQLDFPERMVQQCNGSPERNYLEEPSTSMPRTTNVFKIQKDSPVSTSDNKSDIDFLGCLDAKKEDRKVLKGRRPLHIFSSSSEDEQSASPKKPFFSRRARALNLKTSQYPKDKIKTPDKGNTNTEDVMFVREFKESPVRSSQKSRKTRLREENTRHSSNSPGKSKFSVNNHIKDENKSYCNMKNKRTLEKESPSDIQNSKNEDIIDDTHERVNGFNTRKVVYKSDLEKFESEMTELVDDKGEPENVCDEDDDIIVVANDENSSEYIDFMILKRIVATMVTNNAEDGKSEDLTPQYVLNRLKALYHQDFSDRIREIQHCLRRAKQRYAASKRSLQVLRPGLRKADIETLSPGAWLNDTIMNDYMSILVSNKKDYGAMSSFCYEEIMRGKMPSVPGHWKDMAAILIPICISSHWSLMCLVPKKMDIVIYNSMPITESELDCAKVLKEFFQMKAGVGDVGNIMKVKNLPKQDNEHDCGVYVCMFARCIVCGNSFAIMPAQVTEFRNWLKNEIIQGRLFVTGENVLLNSESESDESITNEESGIECLE